MKTMLARMAAVLWWMGAISSAVAGPQEIGTESLTAYFDQHLPECLDSSGANSHAIDLISMASHDFDHDGRQEALVTASSCITGTAGPDIHSVFTLNVDGSIRELKFNKDNENVKPTGIPLPLIGNRNWVMSVKGNLLCNQFHDGLGAGVPLEECYEYRNGEFLITSVTYGPTFETSFDCRKAKTDREIVACRDAEVARLDLELEREYRALLGSLPAPERTALIASQKQWLKEIDTWAAYKWCCDEVAEEYSKRMRVLQKH